MFSQEMSSIVISNTNSVFPEFTAGATPSISKETLEIFRKQNFNLPSYVVNLKRKVGDLEQTQTKLLGAKEHSTRDKIISLLAMSLAINILICGILGTYYASTMMNTIGGQVAVALVPISTFLIINVLTQFYNDKWSDDKEEGVVDSEDLVGYLVMPIIGPFIPVWKTFGDISRYQKAEEQKAKEICDNAEKAKKFFIQNREQAGTLLSLLKKGILETQNSLESAKTLSIKSPETESALSTKLEQLRKAAEELEAAMTFFAEE